MNFINIAVCGLMQSGKTTLATHICNDYFIPKGFTIFYINNITESNWRSYFEKIKQIIEEEKILRVSIILDDISFTFSNFAKNHDFLNYFARIYHDFFDNIVKLENLDKKRKPKLVMWFIYHYAKSILPFLRQAHIIFLTSLTTNEEFLNWSRILGEKTILWDYKTDYLDELNKHPFVWFILGKMGRAHITKPLQSQDKFYKLELKDLLSEFIEKYCDLGEEYRERREILHVAFNNFREQRGLPKISNQRFYEAMRVRYQEVKYHGVWYFKGIKLKDEFRSQKFFSLTEIGEVF